MQSKERAVLKLSEEGGFENNRALIEELLNRNRTGEPIGVDDKKGGRAGVKGMTSEEMVSAVYLWDLPAQVVSKTRRA